MRWDSGPVEATMNERILILVDGTCIFCTGLVRFILRHPRGSHFWFAHLQGETARAVLSRHALQPDIDTIYAVTDLRTDREQVWMDGEAGRRIWPQIYRGAWLLHYVPLPLLNVQYRWFARIRYRLFGQAAACIVPTPEQRARFLP